MQYNQSNEISYRTEFNDEIRQQMRQSPEERSSSSIQDARDTDSNMSDFDINRMRQQMSQMQENLVSNATNLQGLKEKVMGLRIGILDSMMGCESLKEKLWRLLALLEIKLRVAAEFVRKRLNSLELKDKVLSRIKKIRQYIKEMNNWTKSLLTISGVTFIVTGGILGLQYLQIIDALSVSTRETVRAVCKYSVIFPAVIIGTDFLYSLYNAHQNKKSLEQGIKYCEDALQKIGI